MYFENSSNMFSYLLNWIGIYISFWNIIILIIDCCFMILKNQFEITIFFFNNKYVHDILKKCIFFKNTKKFCYLYFLLLLQLSCYFFFYKINTIKLLLIKDLSCFFTTNFFYYQCVKDTFHPFLLCMYSTIIFGFWLAIVVIFW